MGNSLLLLTASVDFDDGADVVAVGEGDSDEDKSDTGVLA